MWTRGELSGKGSVRKLLHSFFFFYYLVSSKPSTMAFCSSQWLILPVWLLCFLTIISARENSFLCSSLRGLAAQSRGRGRWSHLHHPHGLICKGVLWRKDVWSSKQTAKLGGSESTQNTSKRKWILFANRRRRKGGGGSRKRQAESQGP